MKAQGARKKRLSSAFREDKNISRAKVLIWLLFFSTAAFSVWKGTNSHLAEAADTSSTRTVTVNATIASAIEIYIADTTIDLSVPSPGSDAYDSNEIVVDTSAQNGYKLYAGQTKQLEHTADAGVYITEANMGGQDDPFPYTSSTTGLAFSLSGTPAESLWNAAAGSVDCNYSSFTSGSGVEVNNYASYSASNTTVTVLYRLDVTASQRSGTYQNNVTWYAVTND